MEDAGVVVEHVELAEVADGSLDEDRDVGIARDVSDHRYRLPLQVGDGVVDRLVVDVRGDHPGAFADECVGRHTTHATPRAGNQRDLTVESSHQKCHYLKLATIQSQRTSAP